MTIPRRYLQFMQQRDYHSACVAAAERGWITSYGRVINKPRTICKPNPN